MRLCKNNYNIPLSLQINDLLNFLTQSTKSVQTVLKYHSVISYANTMAVIEDFVCYDLKLKGLGKRTTLILSNTRELNRVPSTK